MSLRIGVFDSGIGGLTVLKELVDVIPAEYVYIGDSLRAPYGNKQSDELLEYMKELIGFLQEKKCDVFVNACNSLSSLDTEKLLRDMNIPHKQYVDMVSATQQHLQDIPQSAHVLIYGTVATIQSGAYQNVFKGLDVTTQSSALLAQAIETGEQIVIDEEIDMLLDTVLEKHITHIFLACTHYPLVLEYIEKRCSGLGVTCINPAVYVPDSISIEKRGDYSLEIYTTKQAKGWEVCEDLFPGTDVVEMHL